MVIEMKTTYILTVFLLDNTMKQFYHRKYIWSFDSSFMTIRERDSKTFLVIPYSSIKLAKVEEVKE